MTQLVNISTFVDKFRSLENGPITTASVLELLHDTAVEPASVRRYAQWYDDRYGRHLIHRDDYFEIIMLCWRPGHRTPIHTHNGQLGWATIVIGELDVVNYQWHGCDRPENQNVVGIDCLAGGQKVDVRPTEKAHAVVGGPVATVTKQQSIHQISCPDDFKENSASIHIYSRPIDSCVAFDLEHKRCARRVLRYDTIDGKPNPAPAIK
ncbi:MAG: cysteine dioxygenase family protein [Planctomycetes bacterium]|nr:cysteine dioxygenase family protein [Planctomycetota bacterium]